MMSSKFVAINFTSNQGENMQKIRLIFLYISIFIIVPHYAFVAYNKQSTDSKKRSFMRRSRRHVGSYCKEYKARVEGVECALCAQNVIDLLKDIKGISNIQYDVGMLGYEDGFLVVSWDISQGDIPESMIKNILVKEQFIIQNFEAA